MESFLVGCREVVHSYTHVGGWIGSISNKHENINAVHDSAYGPPSVSKNHVQSHIQHSRNLV